MSNIRPVIFLLLLLVTGLPDAPGKDLLTSVPSLPATPRLKCTKVQWTAQQTSRALEELQEYSPGLIIAPLKDEQYSILTDDTVQHFVIEYWKPIAAEMRLAFVETSGNNCNNYASALRMMLNFASMRSAISEPIVGTAIVFHAHSWGGLPPSNENHDVVLFYTETGWWVAEAQSGFLAPLKLYPNRSHLLFISLH